MGALKSNIFKIGVILFFKPLILKRVIFLHIFSVLIFFEIKKYESFWSYIWSFSELIWYIFFCKIDCWRESHGSDSWESSRLFSIKSSFFLIIFFSLPILCVFYFLLLFIFVNLLLWKIFDIFGWLINYRWFYLRWPIIMEPVVFIMWELILCSVSQNI